MPALATLPALADIRFRDEIFGGCPVSEIEGYREGVLLQLPQITELDSEACEGGERSRAENGYLRSVLEFTRQIDAIKVHKDPSLW